MLWGPTKHVRSLSHGGADGSKCPGVDWAGAGSYLGKANWEGSQSLEELSGFFLKFPGLKRDVGLEGWRVGKWCFSSKQYRPINNNTGSIGCGLRAQHRSPRLSRHRILTAAAPVTPREGGQTVPQKVFSEASAHVTPWVRGEVVLVTEGKLIQAR